MKVRRDRTLLTRHGAVEEADGIEHLAFELSGETLPVEVYGGA